MCLWQQEFALRRQAWQYAYGKNFEFETLPGFVYGDSGWYFEWLKVTAMPLVDLRKNVSRSEFGGRKMKKETGEIDGRRRSSTHFASSVIKIAVFTSSRWEVFTVVICNQKGIIVLTVYHTTLVDLVFHPRPRSDGNTSRRPVPLNLVIFVYEIQMWRWYPTRLVTCSYNISLISEAHKIINKREAGSNYTSIMSLTTCCYCGWERAKPEIGNPQTEEMCAVMR